MSGSDQFDVPARRAQAELLIKRSRFIATVDFVADRAAFGKLLDRQRADYPDAGHHCWAYVAGVPGGLRAADKSDDGEPRGTAGRPMLNVLEHSGVGYVGAIVTRYFGGVKLGAGGLVRAYSQSVGAALDALTRRTHFVTREWAVTMPYALLASVEHWLATTPIQVTDKAFADDVSLVLQVPLQQTRSARDMLATLGQGSIRVVEEQD